MSTTNQSQLQDNPSPLQDISRLHRTSFLSQYFRFGLNLLVPILLLVAGSFAAWNHGYFWIPSKAWPMEFLCLGGFLLPVWFLSKIDRFPSRSDLLLSVFLVSFTFLMVIGVIAMSRVYYSRSFLSVYALGSLLWIVGYHYGTQVSQLQLALVPGTLTQELQEMSGATWQWLSNPDLTKGTDGIVVDPEVTGDLSDEWIRFLSWCRVEGLPVYNAREVYEHISGQVHLEHLTEEFFEGFQVPRQYLALKRVLDVILVLVALPVVLPLTVVIAAAIKLDSEGPVFFRQERVGQRGQTFRMVKFRSMYVDQDNEPRFANEENQRITRVGNFLREYGLDELPQVWNVLKGEMSLVGPRPEQVPFAEQFDSDIPFYVYRHLVKPGITGWAQVNHGYTSGQEQTHKKLKYDLYYIKNLSLWLDLFILYRTVLYLVRGRDSDEDQ